MEYQKIENLLNDESNEPSKFRTRNWVEINDESRGTYEVNEIEFKTTMLRSNLCDYADAYIFVKGTIKITGVRADAAIKQADERDKGVTFKNCAPFTKCISRINNTDIDNAKDIDIVMLMSNLIEYSDNYTKTSGSLYQYYKDEPSDNIADSESFKSKIKITGKMCKMYVQNNSVTYFDSFGVEHIPKEIKTFVKNKNIKTNIFRIQAYDSVMCRYFCIGFIDFMLKGKTLTDYTNSFSPYDFKKNNNVILSYFKYESNKFY